MSEDKNDAVLRELKRLREEVRELKQHVTTVEALCASIVNEDLRGAQGNDGYGEENWG